MNSTLDKNLRQADGRYFTDTELSSLESYANTYSIRVQTYSLLCQQSDAFVQETLDRLALSDRHVVQEHGEKCHRDMSYVLRSIAVAILKDDDSSFREQLVLWMQNIMLALSKEAQSARAYRHLRNVIVTKMPSECADLVNTNLDEFIQALTTAAS